MQAKSPTKTNIERAEATRSALIKAARALFATKGYADTSTPEIVTAAGVTRGALYHHFEDKLALFRAVVAEEFRATADQIEAASQSPASALDALKQGSRGFIAAMQQEGRARIMLRDGPAVLGQSELTQLDQSNAARTLREGLQDAMRSGELRTLPLDALTAQMSALFDRAALAISEGARPEDHLQVLDMIFDGLAN